MKKRRIGLSHLNLFLTCACLLTLALTETIVNVKARATCNRPPLLSPSYVGTYWQVFTTVNVEIDDAWEQVDRDALASGTDK